MEENGLKDAVRQKEQNAKDVQLSPSESIKGEPFKLSRVDETVDILRCALFISVYIIYVIYSIKNSKVLTLPTFFITFLCAVLFTAIGLYAMPVIVRDLTGRQKAYYPKTSETKRHFWYICIAALGIYFIFTLIGALMYKYANPEFQGNFFRLMQKAWMKGNTDAQHYFDIAEHGYVNEGNEKLFIVFFPLFPYLVRLLNFITKNSYLSSQLINITASVFGAGMLYLTFHKLFGSFPASDKRSKAGVFNDRAFFAVIIALLLPGMIFICSPMTEPLFLLLTASCFYFIGERKFLIAALFAALAGFTRSVGILLVVPIVFEAISDIIRTRRNKKPIKTKLIILFAAAFIACLGTLVYLLINLHVTGDAFKFTEYQKNHWHQSIGFFADTPRYLLSDFIRNFKEGDISTAFSLQFPQLIMIFGALIIYLFAAKRLPASYTLYFLAYFIIAVGCTWLLSAVRYFSLLLPLPAAIAALCRKKGTQLTAVSVLSVLNFVYIYMYMARMHIY